MQQASGCGWTIFDFPAVLRCVGSGGYKNPRKPVGVGEFAYFSNQIGTDNDRFVTSRAHFDKKLGMCCRFGIHDELSGENHLNFLQ